MNDILKIVQPLEDSNILLKGVPKAVKNETKAASLLGNLLSQKGIVRTGSGNKKEKEL